MSSNCWEWSCGTHAKSSGRIRWGWQDTAIMVRIGCKARCGRVGRQGRHTAGRPHCCCSNRVRGAIRLWYRLHCQLHHGGHALLMLPSTPAAAPPLSPGPKRCTCMFPAALCRPATSTSAPNHLAVPNHKARAGEAWPRRRSRETANLRSVCCWLCPSSLLLPLPLLTLVHDGTLACTAFACCACREEQYLPECAHR